MHDGRRGRVLIVATRSTIRLPSLGDPSSASGPTTGSTRAPRRSPGPRSTVPRAHAVAVVDRRWRRTPSSEPDVARALARAHRRRLGAAPAAASGSRPAREHAPGDGLDRHVAGPCVRKRAGTYAEPSSATSGQLARRPAPGPDLVALARRTACRSSVVRDLARADARATSTSRALALHARRTAARRSLRVSRRRGAHAAAHEVERERGGQEADAQITPAAAGTITVAQPSARATPSAVHRPGAAEREQRQAGGSWPRSTACTRAALAMFSLTSRWMPQAASSTLSPSGSATCVARSPPRAASTSSVIRPPRKKSGSR